MSKKFTIQTTKGPHEVESVAFGRFGRWLVHLSIGCDGGPSCGFDETGDSACAGGDDSAFTVTDSGTGMAIACHLQTRALADGLAKALDDLLPRSATIDPWRPKIYTTPEVRQARDEAVQASRKLCEKEVAQVAEFEESF